MGDDFKIKEKCAAIKEAGFQIDLNPYAEILTPDFNIFDPICEAMLQDSINLQKRRFPDRKAQIWTSSFIQTVDSYAKKYGFSVLILNPAHPFGSVTLATVGKNLVLGAGSTINFTESGLIFILDHEVGHFRDQNFFMQKWQALWKKGVVLCKKGFNYPGLILICFDGKFHSQGGQNLTS